MLKRMIKSPFHAVLGGSVLALAVAGILNTPQAFARTVNVTETGSTLLYPLFNLWVP